MLYTTLETTMNRIRLHYYMQIFSRFERREASLTTIESYAMECIYALGEPTIAEFARMMGISAPNAAYKIGSLITKGYVEKVRSEQDHREYHLHPTQKYMDYYQINEEYLRTVARRCEQRFTPEQIAQLDEMLSIINTELMPELDLDQYRKKREESH